MKKHFSGKQKAQIVLELLKEEKTVSQIASEYSVHPNQLYRWKAQALEGLPKLFENDHKAEKAQQVAHDHQVEELYAEIGKLTTQLAWLKKNLASNLSRSERYQLIEWDSPDLSIQTQAELLGVNRTNLYYCPVGPSAAEIATSIASMRSTPPIPTTVLGGLRWFCARRCSFRGPRCSAICARWASKASVRGRT